MPTLHPVAERGRPALWAVAVLGFVVAAGLISWLATLLVEDRDGTGTATFPPVDGYRPEVAAIPEPLGLRAGWNGTAFIQSNLWTHGDEQFAVWVDPEGAPIVGRRRLPDGQWSTTDLGKLPGNPLSAPTDADPHNVYAIAVDAGGYVHVAGNMHADRLRYVRSARPGSIDGWLTGTMVGAQESSVTYPAFIRAPDGALLFFYRDGVAGSGDTVVNRLEPGPGPTPWERVTTLVDGRSSGESPYLQRVAVDPVHGAIHVVFVWRGSAGLVTNRDISYARSDDGGATWRASNGTSLPTPMNHADADVVVPTDPGSLIVINQGGLAVDGRGRPHAVFRVRSPGEGEGDGDGLLHVWQEGRAWRQEVVASERAVEGRPALVAAGTGTPLLLWTERGPGRGSTLRLTELDRGTLGGEVALAHLPVTAWEATFDDRALLERAQLHLLLPTEAGTGGDRGAPGVVASWDLAALTGARRHPPAGTSSGEAGEEPASHAWSSDRWARPWASRTWLHSSAKISRRSSSQRGKLPGDDGFCPRPSLAKLEFSRCDVMSSTGPGSHSRPRNR